MGDDIVSTGAQALQQALQHMQEDDGSGTWRKPRLFKRSLLSMRSMAHMTMSAAPPERLRDNPRGWRNLNACTRTYAP